MRIGAVVTCLPGSPFVKRAVESVLSQVRTVDELIVVIDGEDLQLAQSLSHLIAQSDLVFCVVSTNGSRGASAARNAGTSRCSTDILTFLDDDDWWRPSYLVQVEDAWTRKPDSSFVYSGHETANSDGKLVGRGRRPRPCFSQDHQLSMLVSQFVHSSSCFSAIRADIARAGGYDETLKFVHDRKLYLQLLKKGEATLIAGYPVVRTNRPTSLSKDFDGWEEELTALLASDLAKEISLRLPEGRAAIPQQRARETLRYARMAEASRRYGLAGPDPAIRVLFHTINGNGMGHLMRSVAVAVALRRLLPEAEIAFITSCESVELLHLEEFLNLKVPSWVSISKKRMHSARRALAAVKAASAAFISSLDPQVIVADTFPLGSQGELYPYLRSPSTKKCLILNPRGETRTDELTFASPLFDRVLIPFEQDEVNVGVPGNSLNRRYVGAIVYGGRAVVQPRPEVRAKYGIQNHETAVLVSCGGGGNPDATKFLQLAAKAAQARPNLRFFFLRAPLLPAPLDVELPSNAMWFSAVPLSTELSAFDAAITACGLNSLQELEQSLIPSVMLALGYPSSDQMRNGTIFQVDGRSIFLGDVKGATCSDVATALSTIVDRGSDVISQRRVRKRLTGAELAALEILDLCNRLVPDARSD